MKFASQIICITLLLFGCARAPLKERGQSLRLTELPQDNLLDDVESMDSLKAAIQNVLKVYSENKNLEPDLIFGATKISRQDYQLALKEALNHTASPADFINFMRANFAVYEVYGSEEGWGDVFSTGYYAPIYKGSRRPSKEFSQPILKTPQDFVTIDLSAYANKRPDLEWLQKLQKDQGGRPLQLRGRLQRGQDGSYILPYYTRAEIDGAKDYSALLGKNLALAWLDPVDAIYLQIQGSGAIEFPNGRKMYVGYDKQNGYPWYPIGRALKDKIPIEQMTMQRVRAHLKTLTPQQLREILDRDPSYVFFRKLEGAPLGSFGSEVVGQRTIASDNFLFPKGVLAFLDISVPVFKSAEQADPSEWQRRPRIVLDVDTGGAIRGGGRIDLYMGEGPVMGQMAGVMKQHGKLWYLAPKPEFVEKLKINSQR